MYRVQRRGDHFRDSDNRPRAWQPILEHASNHSWWLLLMHQTLVLNTLLSSQDFELKERDTEFEIQHKETLVMVLKCSECLVD